MRSSLVLPAVGLLLGAAMVLAESDVAFSIVLTDGLPAALVLALATIPGMLVLRLLGVREESPVCRVIFGGGAGVGILCLLELTLGAAGGLSRGPWLISFGALVAMSLLAYRREIRHALRRDAALRLPALEPHQWLWLAVVPFAALAMIVAAAPPGTLWAEEGNGYDVLEYHLAVPKAYLAAGGIVPLPGNIYSNFPLNAEMLYLLAMVLKGGAVEGVFLAQAFNMLLAGLAVAACWAAARPLGSRAATVAAVLAGTCGWFVYLSGVAYVENALLLFTALALAACVRWWTTADPDSGPVRTDPTDAGTAPPPARGNAITPWAMLAGLYAGLACGCKYTAAILVAGPILPAILLDARRRIQSRFRSTVAFALGAFLTFCPWMIRNTLYCGNPIFPLATKVLGADPRIWDEEIAARWHNGHRTPPARSSPTGRAEAVWSGVINEPRSGSLPWGMALGGIALFAIGRRRGPVATAAATTVILPLVVILIAQVAAWAGLTHLVARFAVPMLPPLLILAAMAAEYPHRGVRAALVACVLVSAAFRLYHIGGLYYDHARGVDESGRIVRLGWHGRTDWFIDGQWPGTAHLGFLNKELPAGARVLMVADARSFYVRPACDYSVVFSPDRLAALVRRTPDAAVVLERLRERRYTHVYVDWAEMDRLRATYGFWPEITEELFVRLEGAGLRRRGDFAVREGRRPYGTIYEVPG